MNLTRRQVVLGLSGATLGVLSGGPSLGQGVDPVLVVVFLRGGADAINLVVPSGDDAYYRHRPNVRVPKGAELRLDSFYGIHPLMSPLLPIYRNGDLAFLHAVGSPDPTRSHFDAQRFMEKARLGANGTEDGWLNLLLGQLGGMDPLRGVSMHISVAPSLEGTSPVLAIRGLPNFRVKGPPLRPVFLQLAYEGLGTEMGAAARAALSTAERVQAIDLRTTIEYPDSDIGAALGAAAAMIRSDAGLRVATAELGGWDHHSNELTALPNLVRDLSLSLAAFWSDLGSAQSRTLTLVMSEFGRASTENGSRGTDHGRGGLMMAMGTSVRGGRVITKDGIWPGLDSPDPLTGRDLAPTTDFRDVFAEVISRHFGLSGNVLPAFIPSPARFPGLYA